MCKTMVTIEELHKLTDIRLHLAPLRVSVLAQLGCPQLSHRLLNRRCVSVLLYLSREVFGFRSNACWTYPASAKALAKPAPSPDAPPVTRTLLSFSAEVLIERENSTLPAVAET